MNNHQEGETIFLTAYHHYLDNTYHTTVYYDQLQDDVYRLKDGLEEILFNVNGAMSEKPIKATSLICVGKFKNLVKIEGNKYIKASSF